MDSQTFEREKKKYRPQSVTLETYYKNHLITNIIYLTSQAFSHKISTPNLSLGSL